MPFSSASIRRAVRFSAITHASLLGSNAVAGTITAVSFAHGHGHLLAVAALICFSECGLSTTMLLHSRNAIKHAFKRQRRTVSGPDTVVH